ncbi:ABC transporter permease [Microbacterium terrisoli]|uniref:ABC transporter permease n=1 Tax=Microbacterium terrisoli TaxID=3242192 RepID=UPI00280464DD|nr:ABC transporter permease [Microbacterium protaetiae]
MSFLIDAIRWIFGGDLAGTDPIPVALAVHILYSVVSVAVAMLIAVPIGWFIGHTGKGRDIAVAISGSTRAVPSFGLFILLVLVMGVLLTPAAAIITFVILAIPSILAGAYAGFEAIDRSVVGAGRAVGMTQWQVLWRIEVPLGLPLLVAGIRSAMLQVVATVTIAAYVPIGGLGQYIIAGFPLQRLDMVLGGAILVAALAFALDGVFALLQRWSVPHGVRPAKRARSSRTAADDELVRQALT